MINANTTANSAMAIISSLVYAAIRNPRPRYGISLLLSIMLISRAKPSAGRILLATINPLVITGGMASRNQLTAEEPSRMAKNTGRNPFKK